MIRAYWDSIEYIARYRYPSQWEDMFQVGLMGLMKALKRLDRDRVKSLDAWVFLNVRGMMFNVRQFPETLSLNESSAEGEEYIDLFEADDDSTKVLVDDLLSILPKREAFIIRMIHFRGYQRTELGKMFGLSSMRIGQLEKRALNQLGVALVSTLDTRENSVASRGGRGHVKHVQTICADTYALPLAA